MTDEDKKSHLTVTVNLPDNKEVELDGIKLGDDIDDADLGYVFRAVASSTRRRRAPFSSSVFEFRSAAASDFPPWIAAALFPPARELKL